MDFKEKQLKTVKGRRKLPGFVKGIRSKKVHSLRIFWVRCQEGSLLIKANQVFPHHQRQYCQMSSDFSTSNRVTEALTSIFGRNELFYQRSVMAFGLQAGPNLGGHPLRRQREVAIVGKPNAFPQIDLMRWMFQFC